MRLNKKLSYLPDWPDVHQHGNEYVVRGQHMPFKTYFALSVVPLLPAQLICRLFFMTNAVVRFTASKVTFNNASYDLACGIPIQFRANRPHLSDDFYKGRAQRVADGRLGEGEAFILKFRRVEMIYGARIIHITSIEDPDRAEQFAIALQTVLEMAASGQPTPAPAPASASPSRNKTTGDHLPE
jgi:hypothetical protein